MSWRFLVLVLAFPLNANAWEFNCTGNDTSKKGGMYSKIIIQAIGDYPNIEFIGLSLNPDSGYEFNTHTTSISENERISGGTVLIIKGDDGTEVYMNTTNLEVKDEWSTSYTENYLFPAGESYVVHLNRCSYR